MVFLPSVETPPLICKNNNNSNIQERREKAEKDNCEVLYRKGRGEGLKKREELRTAKDFDAEARRRREGKGAEGAESAETAKAQRKASARSATASDVTT
jgi:hypothetical protein